MSDTKIEWTSKTWNPVRGCSVVSEGCRNCYAMNFATRFAAKGEPYEGLAYRNSSGAHWTGKVKFIEEHLTDPLKWRKPAKVFVNSMSDLFHESIPDEWIDKIFAVMALAPQHTFQVLTKRPERMLAYTKSRFTDNQTHLSDAACWASEVANEVAYMATKKTDQDSNDSIYEKLWGALHQDGYFPNVHLGVSVEDQKTADERIPLLLETPAAVRWISAEPLLESVDLREALGIYYAPGAGMFMPRAMQKVARTNTRILPVLDWCVIGGESGPGARPFDIAWARLTIQQCKAADVPCFMKQLGANAIGLITSASPEPVPLNKNGWLKNKKGGDMSEWPEDLRIRQFPGERG